MIKVVETEKMDNETLFRVGTMILRNPKLHVYLNKIKADPCPCCGEDSCTWVLVDKFAKVVGIPGLR